MSRNWRIVKTLIRKPDSSISVHFLHIGVTAPVSDGYILELLWQCFADAAYKLVLRSGYTSVVSDRYVHFSSKNWACWVPLENDSSDMRGKSL